MGRGALGSPREGEGARCAPYGKDRASINAVRICLAAHNTVSVCHEAVPPSTPDAHALRHTIPRRFATRHAAQGRTTINAVRSCLVAHNTASVCHEACATGVAGATTFIMGSGAAPQRGSAEGGRPPSAAGHGGAEPPKARPDWEKARTMRALRERPCQHQRRTHMPCGTQYRVGLPQGCTTINARRACLAARSDVSVCHEACGTRPYHHQRQTLMPCGTQYRVGLPRGMRHRRSESNDIHYGVWGSAPAWECRGRAAALCREGA